MTDRIRITAENKQQILDDIELGMWPEWMSATEISRTFHISRSQVNVWGQQGAIDSKPSGKFFGAREQLLYNLIDLVHERTRRRSFKERQIEERPDGLYVSCVDCPGLHHTRNFYTNSSGLGVSTRCKKCHNDRGRAWDQANVDKRNAKKKRASRKAAAAARAATKWEPPKLYPAKPVVQAVSERYGDTTIADIERIAGVTTDSYRSIIRAANNGSEVRVSSIVALFEGLDLHDEWARISADLEKDRPAWHPKHPYCARCFRVSVPHHAKGLCRTCHRNRNVPGWMPVKETKWSMRHAYCVECGGTDSRHHARGVCDRCYQRAKFFERRAAAEQEVGSGHGNDGLVQRQVEAPTDGSVGRGHLGRVSGNA